MATREEQKDLEWVPDSDDEYEAAGGWPNGRPRGLGPPRGYWYRRPLRPFGRGRRPLRAERPILEEAKDDDEEDDYY